MPQLEPPALILTRLFTAQRRLRYARSRAAAFKWFGFGSVLAALALIALWNWSLLPGPWQWLANAGRPRELLWLPLLTGLGGFATCWFVLPPARKTAFQLDQQLKSQERILTAVDWLLSEKPRTPGSEKLLRETANLLQDETDFIKRISRLEKIGLKQNLWLATLLLPLLLLLYLPKDSHLGTNSSLLMGEARVDQLTEDLLKELEDLEKLENPEKKLEELLKKLQDPQEAPQTAEQKRELQRVVDEIMQKSQAMEQAKELLETLAQRARASESMSEKDKQALETLKQQLDEQSQQNKLQQAQQEWGSENFDQAAEQLESLQRELGESAKQLAEQAQQAAEGQMEGDAGQDFDESQGDQFGENGLPQGQSGEGEGEGQGEGDGEGQGEGQGQGQSGQGQGQEGQGSRAGKGTTQEDVGDTPDADGTQSLRQGESESEWLEEYEHLHAPERTEFEKAQTRVRGQVGEDGPKFRTNKEGRGAVTNPSDRQGSGGLLEYREAAENAILRDEIPADYRDNVRVYFESIDG